MSAEERFVREIKRKTRLLERCLEDEAVVAVIAGNEHAAQEIAYRLERLVERMRAFKAARP